MEHTKHTPEPWHFDAHYLTIQVDSEWMDGPNGRPIKDIICRPSDSANSARIVACVNACAGMEDPAAEIARLRKLAEAVRGLNEDSREIGAGMMAHLKNLAE